MLTLRVVYDEREVYDIVYEDVYYSQLDENRAGLNIAFVKEIPFSELCSPWCRKAAERLLEDCGADFRFTDELSRRGNKLFAHYVGKTGMYIVLAKQILR